MLFHQSYCITCRFNCLMLNLHTNKNGNCDEIKNDRGEGACSCSAFLDYNINALQLQTPSTLSKIKSKVKLFIRS